ncbi:MAG: putative rane protein [Micavibrio sp.]|nr:putative rane protein [Micavibrio sp.]
MKPLDVITSVDFGYRLVWAEREYLARLALVPVAVKLLTLGIVMALDWQQEYLRSAVLMLPSFFAYGWMLSHLSRLVFYGQRWPFRPSGDAVIDGVMLDDRAHGISAGTLYFAVICYLLAGINGILTMSLSDMKVDGPPGPGGHEPGGVAGLAALAFLVFFLWSVRLLFLYIPAAAGLSVRPIVRAANGMMLSLQMAGTALVSFVPVALIAWWVTMAVIPKTLTPQEPSTGLIVFLTLWWVLASVLAQMIVTASIAFGIKTMMSDKKKP